MIATPARRGRPSVAVADDRDHPVEWSVRRTDALAFVAVVLRAAATFEALAITELGPDAYGVSRLIAGAAQRYARTWSE